MSSKIIFAIKFYNRHISHNHILTVIPFSLTSIIRCIEYISMLKHIIRRTESELTPTHLFVRKKNREIFNIILGKIKNWFEKQARFCVETSTEEDFVYALVLQTS